MLVLTRKLHEAVTVGDDVRIVVLAIEGDRVRLGIEAPRDLLVRRTGGPDGSTPAEPETERS